MEHANAKKTEILTPEILQALNLEFYFMMMEEGRDQIQRNYGSSTTKSQSSRR